jgi:hypothetical protein
MRARELEPTGSDPSGAPADSEPVLSTGAENERPLFSSVQLEPLPPAPPAGVLRVARGIRLLGIVVGVPYCYWIKFHPGSNELFYTREGARSAWPLFIMLAAMSAPGAVDRRDRGFADYVMMGATVYTGLLMLYGYLH